ncbi:DUF7287 family protein [Halosegnis longus]|uniref:Uncharacterized protein n=1 Tax=Halosegnis longus TaxID=2216012 RepID=A0AAJ4UV88_9EURY|nr:MULTISPECIES: hypothetical protein [Halobacteriales]RNJ25746.1 hypothetical protein Nmn1133_02935 [Salella cibi]
MSRRGQTNIDFAIGMSLFLVTVSFVFLFVPTVFSPFEVAQGQPLVADRAATRLVDTMLAGPDPGTLAPACTLGFFADVDTPGCVYDSSRSLGDALGIGNENVRVAVREGGEVVTLDGTVATSDGSRAPSDPPTTLERGQPAGEVPERATTVARLVTLDGQQVRVEVSVW